MPTRADQTAAVRAFGRFYTGFLGALNEGLLSSPFSLTEARVIYELAQRGATDSATLSADLGLDSGYLSRVVGRLADEGVIARTVSPDDGRVRQLSLTAAGTATFAELDASSSAQIDAALSPLNAEQRRELLHAMRAIQSLLGASPPSAVPYVLRPPQPGDMGWVVQRHGVLYAEEYRWDSSFEAMAAELVCAFVRNFDSERERCWIAEREGVNVASVFLMKKSEHVAQLRMLLVEPHARGLGIARRLVQECTRFARHAGYSEIVLWTNSVLVGARRLYETEGYVLVDAAPHHSFGQELVGENWRLVL